MIKLVIAEDQNMFVEGLSSLLKPIEDIELVARASTGAEAIDLIELHQPDVVLMDINMPEMDGIQATKNLKSRKTKVKVLMLTNYSNIEFIMQLKDIGCDGYVLKNTDLEELVIAIRSLAKGQKYFSKEVQDELDKADEASFRTSLLLSKREIEILSEIGQGLTSQEIANKLHISVYTVETHRKNIIHKLGLKNSAALVRYAVNRGLA